jgi:hypothetical protein
MWCFTTTVFGIIGGVFRGAPTKIEEMKFIFRGLIIFEYRPGAEVNKVIQFNVEGTSIPNVDGTSIPSFSLCIMESKHYAALSDFFKIVHDHIEGKDVDLSDIKVY